MIIQETKERYILLEKIDALFEYRKLPLLIETGGASPSEQKEFISKLVDLQVSIYDLDHYLESSWELDKDKIKFWWGPIYKAMTDLGIPSHKQDEFLSHIKKYQKHEMQLREGKFPSRLEMEYFYFYKSCDVKLLRRIIYFFYPSLKKRFSLADWRSFDLVTEIDDDVEDIYEDQESINGNRFLIGICQDGLKPTVELYLDFMQEILEKIKVRFDHKTDFDQRNLMQWTLDEWGKTNRRIIKTNVDCSNIELKLMF